MGTVGGNNLNHDFKIEYNEVWNLNLERELTSSDDAFAGLHRLAHRACR